MAKGYLPQRRSSDPILQKDFLESNNNSYSVTSNSRANMSYLPRGLTVPLNTMAIPIYTPPSREDVEVGGRVLFQQFIQEELLHQGISEQALEVENPPPDAFDEVSPGVMYGDGDVIGRAASPAFVVPPDGYKTASFIAIGGNIRNIADQFAQSHERLLIQNLASEVDLTHINFSTFHHMLSELFRDGINKYKIVSLFYFCSDVLIRCIRSELHKLGSKLFFWALQFLLRNICKWVHDHGGWERVFSNIFTVVKNVSLITALCVVIGCGFIWIKKNK